MVAPLSHIFSVTRDATPGVEPFGDPVHDAGSLHSAMLMSMPRTADEMIFAAAAMAEASKPSSIDLRWSVDIAFEEGRNRRARAVNFTADNLDRAAGLP